MNLRSLRYDPIPLAGGLDLVTIPLLINPGRVLSGVNFEPDINGGYRRMAGIERLDGRPRPSDADYHMVACNVTGSVAVGDTITGVTSTATAVVIVVVSSSSLVVVKVLGTFVAETFNVSGSPQGTITGVTINSEPSVLLHASYKNLAADNYRADIAAVPGSGYVRGVKYYQGNIYAFRDNAGGTACVMHKATTSGWTAITFGKEIQFTGAVGEIVEGNTVTGLTSGASAVCKRALLRTGTWSASGAGTLVFDTITGTFQSGEALQVGAVTKVTSSSLGTSITLLPGGKFEFDIINFQGSAGTERLYCADGVNLLGEFDGTRWIQIRTGAASDKPKFVKEHRKHLVIAIGSSILTSGTGLPYSWTVLTGASELAAGQTITGLSPEVGDSSSGAMLVLTDEKSFMLYGNDISDFNLVLHSPTSGGKAYTVQNIGYSHFLNTRGVTQLIASQEFGNFQLNVLTRAVQPLIDDNRGLEISSCVIRNTNQYRIFFNDGTGIIMQVIQSPNANAPTVGPVMEFDYATRIMNTVDSVVDVNGIDRVFGAGTDGYVYELERGTSFDGDAIRAHLMLHFNHSKSLRIRKHYLRTILQFRATELVELSVGHDLGFGKRGISQSTKISKTIFGGGGFWDAFSWDDVVLDSPYVPEINVHTPGNGDSIALIISSNTDTNEPFTIHTCIPYYKINRMER